MSGPVCQHCAAPLEEGKPTCPRCGRPVPAKPLHKQPTVLLSGRYPIVQPADGAPTGLVAAPFPVVKPPDSTDEPPTGIVAAPFPVPDAAATSAMPVPYPLARPVPPPDPTAMTSAMPAPFPVARPAPAPDAAATSAVAAPFPVDPASSTIDTGKTAAPFPAEPSQTADTGRVAALFPVEPPKSSPPTVAERRRVTGSATPVSPSDTARTAAPFPLESASQSADTGRMVTPFKDVKDDAGTNRVPVPFRHVEAPFPVAEQEPPEAPGTARVSSPFVMSKKAIGHGTSDEDLPMAPVAMAAPFPLEAAAAAAAAAAPAAAPAAPPSKGLSKRDRTAILVTVVVFLALGAVTVWLVGTAPSGPKLGVVRETTPITPVAAGSVRVAALCGGMQIPARLSVNGSEKGETPMDVALPTALPPGKHELQLRLAGRLGDPVDAQFTYQLPLDMNQPGKAINIELNGCGGY